MSTPNPSSSPRADLRQTHKVCRGDTAGPGRHADASIGGYDLLAPKFDRTPFRTPDSELDATAGALGRLGPFGAGLDVCCGTGAGADAVWRPPFVMYYRTCPLSAVRDDLASSGFAVVTVPLTGLGRREDDSPRCRLVLARKAGSPDPLGG
ncbi:MAG: hypothetical protein ABSB59_23265 [Streptosporangiaceae bacterium]